MTQKRAAKKPLHPAVAGGGAGAAAAPGPAAGAVVGGGPGANAVNPTKQNSDPTPLTQPPTVRMPARTSVAMP